MTLNDFQKAKVIKSITAPKFEIALYELGNGEYIVAYITVILEKPQVSENIRDYKTAAFMFDLKLRELEGH